MRCQHCGHEVPEGSVFCNHCGYKMNQQVTCSYCHQSMPSTSVFCPHCGKAIDNAMNVASKENGTPQETRPSTPQGRTYNEQRQAARKPANAWEPTKPVQPDGDDDDDDNGGGGSSFNRNLILGIIAIALIIGLLSALRHCNSQENDRLQERADSAAIAADNSQDPMAVFSAELSRNGMTEDKAYTGCAMRFTGDNDKPERIVGVTYKDDTDRPFIKIYTLTRDGGQWKTELTQTKYYDGRNISMDNSSLISDNLQIPRQITENGKQYLYFGFVNHLKGAGEGGNGRVTLGLYDVDGKNLTTLTYDGRIKARTDGRQYVYCRGPLESTNTNERRILQREASSIGAIHIATQEEIDAEEEAKAKEEEEEKEKSLEGEANAEEKWNHDNAENMDKLKGGEEVKMTPTQYDKPIINMKEIKKKLDSEHYLVFLDTKGSVVGFNKSSRKYFTVYAGKNATDISFNGDNNVIIKTPSGSISYDLVHDKAKGAN